MERLVLAGLVAILLGFVLVVIGMVLTTLRAKVRVEWAFGGFIGPIPFGFASREDWLRLIIALSLIALAVLLLIGRR
jgi:uncharacterized membrane protein